MVNLDLVQGLLLIVGGVTTTLAISIFSFVLGLGFGLSLAFVRTYEKGLKYFVDIFEKIFRGIPELVLMLPILLRYRRIFSLSFQERVFHSSLCLGSEKRC